MARKRVQEVHPVRESNYDCNAAGGGCEPIAVLPKWAEWLTPGQSCQCKTCRCVYTGRYESYRGGNPAGYVWVGGVLKGRCPVCRRERRERNRKSLPLNPEFIAAIRRHAEEHYEENGWDYLVECYEDSELWEQIADTTLAKCLRHAKSLAALLDDRRSDIQGTAW